MPHKLEIVDGKLYAYGDNSFGQLGLGHNRVVFGKFEVTTGTDQDKIPWINCAVGKTHSVAIKEDNSLWVWGDNRFGQLAQEASVLGFTTPTRLTYPKLDSETKTIELVTGSFFTIIYQYLEKGYGFGEFENFDTEYVEQYRQIVELKPLYSPNKWVSINAAERTIVGLNTEDGYKFADWSGQLFSKTYVRFNALKIGDIFTLYDPGNRNRVLYKKIKEYSKGRGCCPVNALCLHRTYRELVSNIPPNITIRNNQVSVFDVLDPISRQKYEKNILSAQEKYGTNFVFNSAIARNSAMSKYPGIDPWTLQALFLMTDSKNMLDVLLYDALYFSDNEQDTYNSLTLVEKISAIELYNSYSGISLPPYLLNRSNYEIKFSDYVLGNETNVKQARDSYFSPDYGMDKRKVYTFPFKLKGVFSQHVSVKYAYLYKKQPDNSVKRFIFRSRYGYGYPVYRNEKGKLTDFDNSNSDTIYYDNTRQFGLPGCPYVGIPKYIRDLEEDDSIYNNSILTHIVDLPINNNGEITSSKHIIDDPYLLKIAMDQSGNVFQQAFMDPTLRIKTAYSGDISKALSNPGNDPMMFYVRDERGSTFFYIGKLTATLIELLLSDKISAREVNDYYGISKNDLGSMWSMVRNAAPPYTDAQKTAFAKLSGLFYNKLKDQPILDIMARDIYRTGVSTVSTDQFYDFPIMVQYCPIRTNICTYAEQLTFLPYLGISCWTERTERNKLQIFGNYIDKFSPGKTLLSYQTWSGDSKKTKSGKDTVKWTSDGPVVDPEAYQEHTTTVSIVNTSYDDTEFKTVVELDKPFLNNYLIGNLLYDNRPNPNYQAMPFIYFNSIASITEKLQSIPAPLRL